LLVQYERVLAQIRLPALVERRRELFLCHVYAAREIAPRRTVGRGPNDMRRAAPPPFRREVRVRVARDQAQDAEVRAARPDQDNIVLTPKLTRMTPMGPVVSESRGLLDWVV
jgi:hypothetical protein